jgi:hypothetical protein
MKKKYKKHHAIKGLTKEADIFANLNKQTENEHNTNTNLETIQDESLLQKNKRLDSRQS